MMPNDPNATPATPASDVQPNAGAADLQGNTAADPTTAPAAPADALSPTVTPADDRRVTELQAQLDSADSELDAKDAEIAQLRAQIDAAAATPPVNASQTSPLAQPGSSTPLGANQLPPADAADTGPVVPPAPASSTSYDGPKVGTTVAHAFIDPYDNDVEVTRYGVVVATHPRNTDDPESTDRAEIAWLPPGTAVLAVDDLDAL